MFNNHTKKRYTSLPFAIFRTVISIMVFAVMLGGLYNAYKTFSGVDPLKLDSQAVFKNLLNKDNLQKLTSKLPSSISEKIPTNTKLMPEGDQDSVDTSRTPLFKFLLVADSHSENNYLNKALNQGKAMDVKFVIGLGDYTEVGTIDEFKKTKAEFDATGIRYFLVPGDHDFWDARDKRKAAHENFIQIFGPTYQAFTYNNIRFILLDNADNYLGLGETQINWLNQELERTRQDAEVKQIMVFLHEALYHPSSTHIMGMEEPKLKDEALGLAKLLKEQNVKGVFSGDIHYFTKYIDPNGLPMTTIGAVATQRNPQNPRFGVVNVYDDLTYSVEDLEIRTP